MFQTEIRTSEEILLIFNFQEVDYPLIRFYFTDEEVRVFNVFWTGAINEKTETAGSPFILQITISESDFKKITSDLPCTSRWLSASARNIISEILTCSCHVKFRTVFLKAKVSELLIQILSAPREGDSVYLWTEKERSTFIKLKDIINQNLKNNFSIAELAEIAGMNRTKLQTGFKNFFGTTIYAYTLDIKMVKAKTLLRNDRELSLKEIASTLGYRHANHFSAAFKKKFAIAPSAFRDGK